jgi:hypothetical protein
MSYWKKEIKVERWLLWLMWFNVWANVITAVLELLA